ncbi:2-dehydropantoate 2-reductase [Cryobacterium mesophilum]|uniref:2-dehydropantoate 2-reductase n=1 Tax=Terrimesophilobacter mesophilus TaxID=433647 RepID=A0A4R8V6F2_9MICO|nr:2-dehydropantoate 2-reductase [Terrimesophilobacter mesophilus]MBB5634071.1 2-dehydropantoate 2-reductase [Terrimesophilobacter mesophilus]TFB78661.1 2-dehydropantoate 2-reductase [Terrimesophilobacter mesophilus]
MRVAVIGAGAVGGTIAALLERAGHEVEVTARGDHLEAIRSGGIRLGGAWGEHVAPVTANPTLTKAPELAIVTTKALDAAAALRENADWIRGVPVVIVQNGIRSISTARAILRHTDLVGGLAMFAASLVEPGRVAVTTSGATYLGNDDGGLGVDYVVSVLGAVMPVKSSDNFAGAQWTKLIVNQINALPAITGTSAQATIANSALREVLTRSMQEAVAVAIASGIRFEKVQGLSNGLLRLFRRLPAAIAQLLPLVMRWRMGRVPNPGSTLQSIQRGHKTEIDFLNGAIVDAGTAVGVPTPINAALVRLVHEVERTGVFLDAAEIVAEVDGRRNTTEPPAA